MSSIRLFSSITNRAKIRRGVLHRVAGCVWGAATNVLRITSRAPKASLIGYGLVAAGSSAYEIDLRRVDTCVLNPAAPSITGVGFSARLITLDSVAGTVSIHNLCKQSCAKLIESALSAHNSNCAQRLEKWGARVSMVDRWSASKNKYIPDPPLPPRL